MSQAMSMKMEISPTSKALLKQFKNLLTPGELAHAAGAGADVIGKEVERRAPGSIAEAVVVGVDKVGVGFGSGKGGAYVTINHKKAPHAHLVEYGTAEARHVAEKKVMAFEINGHLVFAVSVAPMPAHPFMRPALDAASNAASRAIDNDLQRQIDRRFRGR